MATEQQSQVQTNARVLRVEELSAQQCDSMFALMERHYDRMSRDAFDHDLSQKQWVLHVYDKDNQTLSGFSTLMLLDARVAGRPIKALFTGDTIVNREQWGQRGLLYISGWFSRALIDAYPNVELYWFLISKGYKTYRFLPMFFKDYYPCCDQPDSGALREVVDALSYAKFPNSYDPQRGVIVATPHSYRLRAGIADVSEERLRDPHIEYFVQRNPGHADGNELCCVAPLTPDNFTRLAHRAMGHKPPAQVLPP